MHSSARLRPSALACPSLRAAETFSGLTCLIQQAKKLFHSWRLGIYQEVLAQALGGKFGMGPGKVWVNLNAMVSIQLGTTD